MMYFLSLMVLVTGVWGYLIHGTFTNKWNVRNLVLFSLRSIFVNPGPSVFIRNEIYFDFCVIYTSLMKMISDDIFTTNFLFFNLPLVQRQ